MLLMNDIDYIINLGAEKLLRFMIVNDLETKIKVCSKYDATVNI